MSTSGRSSARITKKTRTPSSSQTAAVMAPTCGEHRGRQGAGAALVEALVEVGHSRRQEARQVAARE